MTRHPPDRATRARLFLSVLIGGLAGACVPVAAADSLEELFRENSRELTLTGGDLTGPGMEFLLAAAAEAQFVCLAEPHNSHDVPIFVTALFRKLQEELSFHYLAIEQGPLITSRIAELAASHSNDDLRKLMKKNKKALHFETVEEVEMIADVARASEGAIRGVWGLDRMLDSRYVEKWLSGEEGGADPEAAFLRERAAWSAENLAMYRSGGDPAGGASPDQHREEGFKEGFHHYYALASSEEEPMPRVIFRFGHTHMGRLDYRSYSSLGRHVGELAEANGLGAFYLNLQVINEPGRYWSLTDYPEYAPLARIGDPGKWIVVDLRPAREPIRSDVFQTSDKLKHLVMNFDAVLLVGGASRGRKL